MTKSPFDALGDTDQGHTNSDEHAQHAGSQTNTSSTNLDNAATTSTSRGESTIDADSDSDGDEDSPLMRKTVKLGQSVLESSIAKATWANWSRSTGLHPQTWTRHTCIKGTLLLVLLTAIILSFAVIRVQDHIKEILSYIDDHKQVGAVLFVTFYTVACWLFLPGSLFTIGAGFLFKPFPFALGIVVLGDILGTIGSFLLGRYIFYDWVKQTMSKHPKFGALDQVIKDDGWKIVVMIRLTPIPFNLITYFFSITSIHIWTMIWATAVGVFPGSCLGIWVGSLLKDLSGVDNPELETKNLVILAMNGVFIVCCILTLSIFGKQALRKALGKLDRHQAALDGTLDGVTVVPGQEEEQNEARDGTAEQDILLPSSAEETGFTRTEKIAFGAIALVALTNIFPITPSSTTKPDLVAIKSLQQLVHKQTLEIESVIQQLYDTISVFQRVVQVMVQLERQVESAIERIEPSKLLATIHSSPPSSSSSSSPSSLKKSYAFEPSLVETAEIAPLDVLDWVGRIRAMYAQELYLKQAQIHPGMTALERFESLADLQHSWGLQKRIDFGLEQEIVERIKAYRRVREFSSRTRDENIAKCSATSALGSLSIGASPSIRSSGGGGGSVRAILDSPTRASLASAQIQQLDLTLDWDTTYSDLKLVRDTLLRLPIVKLRLDYRSHSGPASDIVNRSKRGRPMAQLMIQHPHLVLVDFVDTRGFFSRSTQDCCTAVPISSITGSKLLRPSSPNPLTTSHIREVHIDGTFDYEIYHGRIKTMLEHCPQLMAMTLKCKDFDFVWTIYTLRELATHLPPVPLPGSGVAHFSAGFDRHDPYLETLLIDDNFSNDHITLLEQVTGDHCKLRLLEMRVGFALIANSAITDLGQDCLIGVNKWLAMLEQHIPQSPPSSSSSSDVDQRSAYAILVLEFRGGGGVLKPATVQSLVWILGLAPKLQIRGMTNFEMDTTDWDQVLEVVSLDDLKELSLEETNVNGHHAGLLMNRIETGDPLKVLTLGKTALKPQDV
ncbi:hypothetical protein BG006_010113 [Podila minutissima]|uniref:VTT domain-containing protein n=1 Tax=Podila minutissima TaxID=64525 RepID=A0A9P5ST49_9FUNG|nr:hypothetical protein BG006_010113 [Podila minutissima]